MKHTLAPVIAGSLFALSGTVWGCSATAISQSAGDGGTDATTPTDAGAIAEDAASPDGDTAIGDAALPPPDPSPANIAFAPVAKLPKGEQILYNDWNPSPNTVVSITPDGVTQTVIFKARRVWAMGIARGGQTIAFSSEDPFAQARYGVTIGDAIQQSWLYEDASQTVKLLALGNVNDECHSFGPGDTLLWVCRRYDFANDGSFKGWRIGRFDLTAKSFDFVTEEATGPGVYALGPHVTQDGKTLLYYSLEITPPNKQTYSILKRALPGGAPELVRQGAGRLTLSPDDKKMVYSDYADAGALYVANVDGMGTPVKIAAKTGGRPVFSPDGTKIAYLEDDAANNCQHIQVVHTDGSDATTPTRIHDCSKSKDFITQLAWITR